MNQVQLRAVLDYYAAYPDEIDERLEKSAAGLPNAFSASSLSPSPWTETTRPVGDPGPYFIDFLAP